MEIVRLRDTVDRFFGQYFHHTFYGTFTNVSVENGIRLMPNFTDAPLPRGTT
jgi:hypothetical protein